MRPALRSASLYTHAPKSHAGTHLSLGRVRAMRSAILIVGRLAVALVVLRLVLVVAVALLLLRAIVAMTLLAVAAVVIVT